MLLLLAAGGPALSLLLLAAGGHTPLPHPALALAETMPCQEALAVLRALRLWLAWHWSTWTGPAWAKPSAAACYAAKGPARGKMS